MVQLSLVAVGVCSLICLSFRFASQIPLFRSRFHVTACSWITFAIQLSSDSIHFEFVQFMIMMISKLVLSAEIGLCELGLRFCSDWLASNSTVCKDRDGLLK